MGVDYSKACQGSAQYSGVYGLLSLSSKLSAKLYAMLYAMLYASLPDCQGPALVATPKKNLARFVSQSQSDLIPSGKPFVPSLRRRRFAADQCAGRALYLGAIQASEGARRERLGIG